MKNTSLFLLQNASTLTLQHPHLASLFLAVTLSLHQILFLHFLLLSRLDSTSPPA